MLQGEATFVTQGPVIGLCVDLTEKVDMVQKLL